MVKEPGDALTRAAAAHVRARKLSASVSVEDAKRALARGLLGSTDADAPPSPVGLTDALRIRDALYAKAERFLASGVEGAENSILRFRR